MHQINVAFSLFSFIKFLAETNLEAIRKDFSDICSMSNPVFLSLMIAATNSLECEIEICLPLFNSGAPNLL